MSSPESPPPPAPQAPPDGERRRGFLRAFLVSVLGTGLSRVLGAIREIFIASLLGAGTSSDAFWMAFTIPGAFRRFVADEGLTGALLPAVAKAEEEEGQAEARSLANTVLTALLLVNAVLCTAGILGADYLVMAFAYSYLDEPEKFRLTSQMTAAMMPFVAFVSLVSFFESLLNHRGHFFVPKVAPGVVSASIVACGLVLATVLEAPVWALVAGVWVGGILHAAVNLPWVWRLWGPVGLGFRFSSPRFRAVLRELGKVVVIGLFAQVNILVLRQLAAMLETGAVTWYWNASRMVDLSQGIIAVAIGSALLPGISQAVAAQDWENVRGDLARAVRLAAFLLIPAGAVLLVFSTPVTSILFRHGRYTWHDVQVTSATLQVLVPYLWALAGINILKKVYFALEDRNTLLGIGAIGVVITGGLGMALVETWQVVGLALALSISTCTQLLLYVVVLQRRLGEHLGWQAWVGPLLRMSAAAVPVVAVLGVVRGFGDWSLGPLAPMNLAVFAGGGVAAASVYAGAAWVLGIEELTRVTSRVAARFGR